MIFGQGLVLDLGNFLFFFCAQTFGEPFGVFLKSFWGYFITIICRLLSVLQLLYLAQAIDRKSTRLNSSHITRSRMPSSA